MMKSSSTLSRRTLLASAGALAAATAAPSVLASAGPDHHEKKDGHGGHGGHGGHEGHEGHEGHGHTGSGPHHESLVTAALECVAEGQHCLQHCLEALGAGDRSLAACAQQTTELVSSCSALAGLGAHNSSHLALFAQAAESICRSCEEACRQHLHHEACRRCAEACARCAAECRKLIST
ncbi:MAG: Csp1 family four helix bundle copper storage protein [Acidobacteriota bacterium]